MINKVVLVGRLTRDVELRYTNSGTAVASFSLAVERNFTNRSGEREADFINCVIWRKPAENFSNFTGKGAMVAVEGHLQTRNYQNNQGQRVYVTEVVIDNFQLLETRAQSKARRANQNNDGNSGSVTTGSSINNASNNNASKSNNFNIPENGTSNRVGASQGNPFESQFKDKNKRNSGNSTDTGSAKSNDSNSNNDDSDDSLDISDDDLPF